MRLKFTFLPLFCLVLMFNSLVYSQDLKPEDVYKKTLPSIMTLSVEAKDGSKSLGTAFMAIKDGVAVTAWHAVKDAKYVKAKFSTGEEFESSGLIDKDEKRDIALIKIKTFGISMLQLSPNEPSVGSKSCIIGAPQGLEFSISDGLVSQIQVLDGIKFYQFTCAASPGNSGGPMVDASGNVIGVVSWQVRDGQNLNFAVPSTYVLGLDSTLPTQPWEQVKLISEVNKVEKELSLSEIDKLIADACILHEDNAITLASIDDKLKKSFSQKKKWALPVVPPLIYSSIEDSKLMLEKIETIKKPETRVEILSNLSILINSEIRTMETLVDCIKEIQRSNGWSASATDLISKSIAIGQSSSIIGANEQVYVLIKKNLADSKVFVDNIPLEMQYRYEIKKDETGMRLGVMIYPRNPSYLVLVINDVLADRLGFKDSDQIVSIDGKPFTNILELKVYIKENLGKTIKAEVVRNGKAEKITIKIPKELPKECLKNS